MVDKKLNSTLVSDIAYNDYVAVLGYMDAEWTRAEGTYKPFRRGCDDFISACLKYRSGIKDNYAAFCKANHINQQKPLDSYLYNSACYIPFGHADGLIITLLDDFDPVHHITSQLKTTLEEVCLAFCPTLQSIGVCNDKDIFRELHTLLNDNPANPECAGESCPSDSDKEHKFQKETPLLVFTKYRIDGLALLGEGLLFQQALFKAMAKKINDIITLLGKQFTNENAAKTLILPKDVETFKCSFLDLQGAEEIGTLMFCRNYSVAMTVIAALRMLTYNDVFQEDKRIEDALSNSKTHLSIIKIVLNKQPLPEDVNEIKNNHVFRWTCSSLAVSPQILISKNHTNCNGYLEALVDCPISPGHHSDVEDRIEIVTSQGQEYAGAEEYHRYHAGVGDIVFAYSTNIGTTRLPLMPISSVFSLATANDNMFGDIDRLKEHGRDVIDMTTNMTIPVPKIFGGQERDLHHPFLANVLRQIQQRLCYPNPPVLPKENIDSQHEIRSGRLSIEKLKTIPCNYILPVSLKRSIEHLYQNFAICIADPFLFDMVLDFYDVFATLHRVLTDCLPKLLEVSEDESEKVIGQETVQQIAILVDVISSAFARRMSKAYPELKIRDMSTDFRGGLNQILLAADVPVKSSFGLVRKFAFPEDIAKYKDRVGSVTNISVTPGARCYDLSLGTESEARLAIFQMDVPHVLHLASYCDSLHESAHLVYHGLLKVTRFNKKGEVMKDRIEEIFANLITQIFIFGSDTAKFLRYKLDNYTKNEISIGVDDKDTFVRFTEELIRLFLVTDAIPLGEKPRSWTPEWIWNKDNNSDTATKRFTDMVERFGPVFSEYQRLQTCKDNEKMKKYLSKEFKDIYAKADQFMPVLWSEAIRIYKRYTDDFIDYNKISYDYYDEEVNKIVDKSLADGKPIAQSHYYPDSDNSTSSNEQSSDVDICVGVDPLMLVCKLLYQYMPPFTYEDIGKKAIHLYRTPTERRVDYPEEVQYLKKKEQQWDEFQIDRGAPSLFCPVPSARRKRLLKQIVIIKSFWGISSSMRLRRLEEILSDNWPELS